LRSLAALLLALPVLGTDTRAEPDAVSMVKCCFSGEDEAERRAAARWLLENAGGEQGARMSAMDNATRNAGDMIERLTIEYNRSRQAVITNELIEIISGAEAL